MFTTCDSQLHTYLSVYNIPLSILEPSLPRLAATALLNSCYNILNTFCAFELSFGFFFFFFFVGIFISSALFFYFSAWYGILSFKFHLNFCSIVACYCVVDCTSFERQVFHSVFCWCIPLVLMCLYSFRHRVFIWHWNQSPLLRWWHLLSFS